MTQIIFRIKFVFYQNNLINIILRTVDIVGLYPNIPQEEGLSAFRKQLDNRMEKYISSDMLSDLAEVVPKSNILKFGKKKKSKKEGLQSERNLHLLIVFCLWQNPKRKFLEKQNLNLIFGEGILMIYFPFGSMENKN